MDQIFLTLAIEANISCSGASTDSLFSESKKLLKLIFDSKGPLLKPLLEPFTNLCHL